MFENVGDGTYACGAAENFHEKTADNFILEIVNIATHSDGSYWENCNVSKTYDPVTGTLVISGLSHSETHKYTGNAGNYSVSNSHNATVNIYVY